MTRKLGPDAAAPVVDAIGDAVAEGLAEERERPDMSSSKDRPSRVHGRTGLPCPVCGDTIRAVEYSSYTVNYCPTCQTGGKILADNDTSKFSEVDGARAVLAPRQRGRSKECRCSRSVVTSIGRALAAVCGRAVGRDANDRSVSMNSGPTGS